MDLYDIIVLHRKPNLRLHHNRRASLVQDTTRRGWTGRMIAGLITTPVLLSCYGTGPTFPPDSWADLPAEELQRRCHWLETQANIPYTEEDDIKNIEEEMSAHCPE